MRLYDIDKDIYEALEQAQEVNDNGEYEVDIDAIMVDRAVKLENIALYIKNLTALADSIKTEEKALADRRKSIENKVNWLKEYALNSVINFGGIETAKVKLFTRKSESVAVDLDKLDKEYIKERITFTADRELLRKLIKSGEIIDGAELVEKQNLQIK